MKNRFLEAFLLVLFFTIGAIAYTWPAAPSIWEKDTEKYMSDGTDQTPSPFLFDMIHRGYLEDPGLLLYGAYPNSRLDAPEGLVSWFATAEKLAGLIFPIFVPVEQVGALLGLTLLVFNGIAFYALGRALGWSRALTLGLSIAWAFSAYTRARVQVHVNLAGLYGVPLAFLGLICIAKDRSLKGLAKSALCFLLVAASSHYYLIYFIFFSPFLLLYYFSYPQVRNKVGASLIALVLAITPAALFLAGSFLRPVPSEFKSKVANVLPTTGQSRVWPHRFLTIFSADPEDYFSGDIAIGTNDVIPLRANLTEQLRSSVGLGNFHEHAHGIRWVIWASFLLALLYVFWRRSQFSFKNFEAPSLIVLFIFGLFAFLCSLPPDWGFMWGPSAWIHGLVERVRVSNRSSIFTHFCILMMIGTVAQKWLCGAPVSIKAKRISSVLFVLLIILDFPPFMNPMPMARTVPSWAPQIAKRGMGCGLGFHFPYVSGVHQTGLFYYLLQSLRETDCSILNAASDSPRDAQFIQRYGYGDENFLRLVEQNNPAVRTQLIEFARCNKLDWMAFDSRTPAGFIREFCDGWGGSVVSPNLCLSKKPPEIVPSGQAERCFSQNSEH